MPTKMKRQQTTRYYGRVVIVTPSLRDALDILGAALFGLLHHRWHKVKYRLAKRAARVELATWRRTETAIAHAAQAIVVLTVPIWLPIVFVMAIWVLIKPADANF